MSFLSRWFGTQAASSSSSAQAGSARKPAKRARLQVETLEQRDTPSNDFFVVNGPANTQVGVTFEYESRRTPFWDEIGVYTVQDDQGRVANLLPTDPGYVQAMRNTARMVFEAGEIVGTEVELFFTAGTRLAFYIIRDNTMEAWTEKNPINRTRLDPEGYFSVQLANRDGLDHVHAQKFPDGSMKLFWENGHRGGDRDYNDDVILVKHTNGGAVAIGGVAGQRVPVQFTKSGGDSAFRSEVGLFLVDDVSGRIGTLNPGDEGYVQAALARRRVLFAPSAAIGATKTVRLPGGRFFGTYIVGNGTAFQLLSRNPENNLHGNIFVHFSFANGNVDGREHVKWFDRFTVGFEDSRDPRHRDLNDVIVSMRFKKPLNSRPFVVGAGLTDITVSSTAADRTIDLANLFDDRDITNTIVRVNTIFGDFKIKLLDRTAPRTVANFLNYVRRGDYNNSIFHRSAKTNGVPFVLQGGGFNFIAGNDPQLVEIAQDPAVQNEFNRSNIRGTIAMAKLGGNPNSATSEWFVNLGNNSANLDTQNGGFTVFAEIMGDGMKIIDRMARLPVRNFSQNPNDPDDATWPFTALGELPLRGYTGGPDFPNDTVKNQYAFVEGAKIVKRGDFLRYSVDSVVMSDGASPNLVTATIVNNRLTLAFENGQTGTATVTVRATDKFGKSVTDTFVVTVTA
jgi:cyclophilin family peptidyl-prolyl cis-trans isomerase